jgi:hypothetical protein
MSLEVKNMDIHNSKKAVEYELRKLEESFKPSETHLYIKTAESEFFFIHMNV